MKKTTFGRAASSSFIAAAIALGGLVAVSPALAAASAEAKTVIPATSEAIWQSIDKETEQLAALIQSNKLEDVHHRAFAIRDLVAALPSHSASLGADKVAAVKANSKFVAALAERLDATGDAKDKAGTAANFEKLKGVLKTIRSSYGETARK